MDHLELFLFRFPPGLWWSGLAASVMAMLVSGGMVATRVLLWRRKTALVAAAYRWPRLVRLSQSLVWTGCFLVSMGLVYFMGAARWPSMDAHVFAIAHRVWRAKASGDLDTETLRTARREQAPWVTLREAGTSTLGAWKPALEISVERNTAQAAHLVAWAHVFEVLGMVLIGLGVFVMGVRW